MVKQASKERPIFNLKNLNLYGSSFRGQHTSSSASIRAIQCTLDIHKTIETSHFTAAIAGDTNCNISGRYVHFGSESRQTGLCVSQHCECAKTTGVSYQAGKMLPSSNTTHRISRLPDQLHRHAASSAEREAPKHSGRMEKGVPESFYVNDRVVCPSRPNDPLHTNGTCTGSIALPRTTKTAHKHAAPPEHGLPEQDHDFLIKALINRSPMVDLTSNSSIQQHPINLTSNRYGHIHGCIHPGMGGPRQWNTDGGTLGFQESKNHINVLELKAALTAIKSFLCTQPRKPQHINLQMDNSTAVAYVNKRGGTKSSTLAELAVEIWAVCHQNNIWITAHHLPGTQNVDADWASRQFNERTQWTLDKSIFTNYPQTTKICVTTPRSRGDECGCNNLAMEQMDIIHSPPNSDATSHPEEDLERPGDLSAHCPKLAGQDMIPLLLQLLVNIPAILPIVGAHDIFTIQPGVCQGISVHFKPL